MSTMLIRGKFSFTKDETPESGGRSSMILHNETFTIDNLWDKIVAQEGKSFLTKKGLPFTYSIKGGELFTDRRERSITRSTFEKAYEKLLRDQVGEGAPRRIVGPKTLNVYGAPYVWAVFTGIGMIEEEQYIQEEMHF